MKTKAVIYARVSTDHQQTLNQIEELKRYAKEQEFSIEKVFDESISGTIEERDKLNKLKDYVKKNDIKQILCYQISRLGRNTKNTINLIDYFKTEGVNIYLRKENLNTLSNEPKDTFLLNILASIADLELSSMKATLGTGRDRSARQGNRAGLGFLPYGFTTKNKKLIVDEKEAEVVKEIFNSFLEGKPMYSIAITLNSKSIPTRRQMFGHKRITRKNGHVFELKWRNNAIYNILKNPIYKGERRYKGETIFINDHIIDAQKWNEVQEKLKANIGKKVRTANKYLFRGKLICGICDYMYQARTEARYTGPAYYYCNGKSDQSLKCKGGQFRVDMIDDILFDNIFNRDFSTLAQYFEDMYKSKTTLDNLKKQLITLHSEIEVLNISKVKIRNLWIANQYDTRAEFDADWIKCDKEQNEIKNAVRDIEMQIEMHNKIDISEKINEIRNSWKGFENKRDIVQKYVDQVLIWPVKEYNKDEFVHKTVGPWGGEVKSYGPDKLIYMELFAFKAKHPIKIVMSSRTKRVKISKNDIVFNKDTKTLTLK